MRFNITNVADKLYAKSLNTNNEDRYHPRRSAVLPAAHGQLRLLATRSIMSQPTHRLRAKLTFGLSVVGALLILAAFLLSLRF